MQVAAVVEGVRIVGLERDGAIIVRERRLGPLQVLEHVAAIVEGLDEIRTQRDRLVEIGQRLVEPAEIAQHAAAAVQQRGVAARP